MLTWWRVVVAAVVDAVDVDVVVVVEW